MFSVLSAYTTFFLYITFFIMAILALIYCATPLIFVIYFIHKTLSYKNHGKKNTDSKNE